MGMIVGNGYSYIECDDPHGRGCRTRTPTLSSQDVAQAVALQDQWHNNQTTGAWYCDRCSKMTAPVRLTKENWRKELGESGLPEELIAALMSLVSATLHWFIRPTAEPRLIFLAKQHLSGGIKIDRILYDIFVHTPHNAAIHRHIFVLVPAYLNGTLKRLDEFN